MPMPSPGSQEPSKGALIAFIGLVGVLGGALFANWDKVFPNPQPSPTTPESAPAPTSVPTAASSASPSPAPQPAQTVKIPDSCAPAIRVTDQASLDAPALKCSPSSTSSHPSGPDYVSELSVDEFVDHAIRNSKLIDSYIVKVKGSTEIEAAANFHNMRSVVEFAEFLNLNLNNLREYQGTNPQLQRAIEHGEHLDQYRAQLARLQ